MNLGGCSVQLYIHRSINTYIHTYMYILAKHLDQNWTIKTTLIQILTSFRLQYKLAPILPSFQQLNALLSVDSKLSSQHRLISHGVNMLSFSTHKEHNTRKSSSINCDLITTPTPKKKYGVFFFPLICCKTKHFQNISVNLIQDCQILREQGATA